MAKRLAVVVKPHHSCPHPYAGFLGGVRIMCMETEEECKEWQAFLAKKTDAELVAHLAKIREAIKKHHEESGYTPNPEHKPTPWKTE